jgi:hypothetical protein
MKAHSPVTKFLGLLLFAIGSGMLVFSMLGLMPGDRPFTASSALFTTLLVNILMLLVGTIMASIGMFVLIYGGDWGSSKEPSWDED